MTPSRSRAATREAMSPFPRRLVSSAWLPVSSRARRCCCGEGEARRRCIYAGVQAKAKVSPVPMTGNGRKLAHVSGWLLYLFTPPLFCVPCQNFPVFLGSSLRPVFFRAIVFWEKYLLHFIRSVFALKWRSPFISTSTAAVCLLCSTVYYLLIFLCIHFKICKFHYFATQLIGGNFFVREKMTTWVWLMSLAAHIAQFPAFATTTKSEVRWILI